MTLAEYIIDQCNQRFEKKLRETEEIILGIFGGLDMSRPHWVVLGDPTMQNAMHEAQTQMAASGQTVTLLQIFAAILKDLPDILANLNNPLGLIAAIIKAVQDMFPPTPAPAPAPAHG